MNGMTTDDITLCIIAAFGALFLIGVVFDYWSNDIRPYRTQHTHARRVKDKSAWLEDVLMEIENENWMRRQGGPAAGRRLDNDRILGNEPPDWD